MARRRRSQMQRRTRPETTAAAQKEKRAFVQAAARFRTPIDVRVEGQGQDVFDHIEMFYNPNRKHTNNGMLPPVDYEIKQWKMNEASV